MSSNRIAQTRSCWTEWWRDLTKHCWIYNTNRIWNSNWNYFVIFKYLKIVYAFFLETSNKCYRFKGTKHFMDLVNLKINYKFSVFHQLQHEHTFDVQHVQHQFYVQDHGSSPSKNHKIHSFERNKINKNISFNETIKKI